MAHEFSKIVVVGAPGSGKSTFVGGITGIYLGTPTRCPIEWNLAPGADWSATVSVAYYKPTTSAATRIGYTTPKQIGNICTSPSQLISLLRRAEILTIYPGIDIAHIFTLNDGAIGRILASTSRISGGMIYIALKYPGVLTKEVTIVDIPGVTSRGTAEKTLESVYVRQLVSECFACRGGQALVIVLLPINVESEQGNQVLSFAKSIDEDSNRTIIVFNHLDSLPISPWSVETSEQHRCFFVRSLPEGSPGSQFFFSEAVIERLRQEEAAFFRLCEPWASQSERGNLGVANILKWCQPSYSPLSRPWFWQFLMELYSFVQIVVYDALRLLRWIVSALLLVYVVCLAAVIYYYYSEDFDFKFEQ